MKTFIAFAALIAVALAAAPQRRQAPASNAAVEIVKEVPSNNIGLEGYNFGYELSDGQKRDESAEVEISRNAEEEVATLRVKGSFSWVDPADGQIYTVNYTADENGFHPEGAHLPVAPVA